MVTPVPPGLASESRGTQAAGKQGERDGIAIADEESGGLAILSAHQDFSTAVHQGEAFGKLRGKCG